MDADLLAAVEGGVVPVAGHDLRASWAQCADEDFDRSRGGLGPRLGRRVGHGEDAVGADDDSEDDNRREFVFHDVVLALGVEVVVPRGEKPPGELN